jgi:ribosomal protein S18 acetylase RimI-like enzyme
MDIRDIALAADENFVVHASWIPRQQPDARVIDRDDLVVVDSGLECDTFNFVCRARLAPATVGQRVRDAIGHFRTVDRPFSWWVGPADRPGDLGDALVDAGLERAETELAMSIDLSRLPGELSTTGELRIVRVKSAVDLEVFARLSAANWSPPDQQVLRFYDHAASLLLAPDCPQWLYLGYLGRRAVATAEAAIGGGVVGLYNISTVPAYRRRGIGTAMTVRPLVDARHAGIRTGILQAAPEGVGVYQRVGFESFGPITEYKPPAPPPT